MADLNLRIIFKHDDFEFENTDESIKNAKIGNGALSETEYPNFILTDKYIIWDCTGFADTKGIT